MIRRITNSRGMSPLAFRARALSSGSGTSKRDALWHRRSASKMSFPSDPRSRMATSRFDRRHLLKGTAAAGAGVAATSMGLGHFQGASAQTVLSFYHDKSPWQDFFVQLGESAQEAIGVGWEPTPYADTTSYQAALLAALPTDQSPDMFTWWSGISPGGPLHPGRPHGHHQISGPRPSPMATCRSRWRPPSRSVAPSTRCRAMCRIGRSSTTRRSSPITG